MFLRFRNESARLMDHITCYFCCSHEWPGQNESYISWNNILKSPKAPNYLVGGKDVGFQALSVVSRGLGSATQSGLYLSFMVKNSRFFPIKLITSLGTSYLDKRI